MPLFFAILRQFSALRLIIVYIGYIIPFNNIAVFKIITNRRFVRSNTVYTIHPAGAAAAFLFFKPADTLNIIFILIGQLYTAAFALCLKHIKNSYTLFARIILGANKISALRNIASAVINGVFASD